MSEDDIYQKLAILFETAPKLRQSETEILVRDEYESAFRIRPHGLDPARHPLADIEMMAAEDPGWASVLREQMELFTHKEITRLFGMSWVDYIRMPSPMADLMIDVATNKLKEDATQHSSVESQLNALLNNKALGK